MRDLSMPAVDSAAFGGTAGQVVRAISPSTEADPVALLVQFLAAVGAVIGDGPHVQVGGSKHPARIWPLLIGGTSSGRKGESWAQVERFVSSFDSYFTAERVTSGLSSGEGIIAAFCDPPADAPIPVSPDKRLLVVEAEFARPLAASRREASTLPTVLRGLWESGHAAVLTKKDPLKATGAHLVVIGHITPRELRLKLGEADIAGGLANRFLPVLVKRSQRISRPTDPPPLRPLADLVAQRIDAARQLTRVRFTEEAAELWHTAYLALCDDEDDDTGAFAEVLARGPAYIHRLALAYALIDGSTVIGTGHLRAALALWRYVAATTRAVFGDISGHSDLDRLRGYLCDAPAGRTRTEITDLFGRNKTAAQLDSLIRELQDGGEVVVDHEKSPGTPGRPATRAYWIGKPLDRVGGLLRGVHEVNEETKKWA